MRRAAGPGFAVLGVAAAMLAACQGGAPKGVDKERLDAAVSEAIGDANTCLMMAEQASGKVVYRYNTALVCDRALPSCEGQNTRKVEDLLALTMRDGQSRTLSCLTTPDGSRGVSWASGILPRTQLAYAAAMEGARTLPGRIMIERLEPRLHDLGL